MVAYVNRRLSLPPDVPLAVRRLEAALRAAGPPLLFGLRLWASVSLALYVAFWLELDNPFWAGTSAAIVCLPQLGASLRKGWFRMSGMLVRVRVVAQLRVLFGDACRLHGGHHSRRPARRHRRRERQPGLPACRDQGQRDLHWHRLRRRCSRRCRPRRRAAAAGCAVRRFGRRDLQRLQQYTG